MPSELLWLLLLTSAALGAYPAWRRYRRWRRDRLRRTGLPAGALAMLTREVPLVRRLPPTLLQELARDVAVFLDEKRFIGQDDLVVDERMRLIIAAQACVLELGRPRAYFPGFTSIIVYPDTYVAVATESDGLVESSAAHVRAGESWYRGPVVLSWADVEEDLAHAGDGGNVVLHEFAHKLDEVDGVVDGAPALGAAQRGRWPTVFMREFERLNAALDRGEHTLLDPYAATEPTEFFAVAVETFFDAPHALRHSHRELYDELAAFFGLDPAAWSATKRTGPAFAPQPNARESE